MRKHALILILTFILAILFCGAVSAASDSNYKVKLNEDTVLTDCNAHNSYYEDIHPVALPWPSSVSKSSIGNTATVSVNANNKQGLIAAGIVGYDFNYDLGNTPFDQVKNVPIKITVDLNYAISANSANDGSGSGAGIDLPNFFDNSVGTSPGINCVDYVSHGSTSGHYIHSFTKNDKGETLTLAKTTHAVAVAHCWSGAPNTDSYASSYATVTFNSIKIEFLPQPDLAVSLDYERDLSYYKSLGYSINDDQTVYGADKVFFYIKVKNNGPSDAHDVVVDAKLPKEFAFVGADLTSISGTYDKSSGKWNIGDLANNDEVTLIITTIATYSGKSTFNVGLNENNDPNTNNNNDSVKINIYDPVILVHGWRGSPKTWNALTAEFKLKGIRYYLYNYAPGLKDPYIQSIDLGSRIRGLKNDWKYKGKFDIVCHSMGALVTRFYIETSNDNAKTIDRWIGVAPVNNGAAIADIEQILPYKSLVRKVMNYIFPDLKKDGAIFNMRTDDPQTKHIQTNIRGKAAGIKYTVIIGKLKNDNSKEVINITKWNNKLVTYLKSLLNSIDKKSVLRTSDGKYWLTWAGDGVVANQQSQMNGATTITELGQNHNNITQNKTTIKKIITILQSN